MQASSDNDLFKDIIKHFYNFDKVIELATFLLEDVGQGGYHFVESRIQGGVPVDNYKLAHDVLDEWIKRSSTATPGALYQVLSKVNPKAADDLESKLVRCVL